VSRSAEDLVVITTPLAVPVDLLQATTARLFAGGGIVADSDPDTEAAEVAAKFRVFQSALSMPA
jgi:isochorismate synthase EntC